MHDLVKIMSTPAIKCSFEKVVKELYRCDAWKAVDVSKLPEDLSKKDALIIGTGNKYRPQYYTHTLKSPCTVVHIKTGEDFWETANGEDRELRTTDRGTKVYTTGVLWCSPNSKWTWNTDKSDTIIRCRLDLPKGTQVIIDRSPVRLQTCEDDALGQLSVFPVVLLPPGEFVISEISVHQRDDHESEEGEFCEGVEIRADPPPAGSEPTNVVDDEYAKQTLKSATKFVDVRLEVTAMMRLPENPS